MNVGSKFNGTCFKGLGKSSDRDTWKFLAVAVAEVKGNEQIFQWGDRVREKRPRTFSRKDMWKKKEQQRKNGRIMVMRRDDASRELKELQEEGGVKVGKCQRWDARMR